MKNAIFAALIVASCPIFTACVSTRLAGNGDQLRGHVVIGENSFAAAMLCPADSFECEVTPSYVDVIMTLHSSTVALKQKRISIETAEKNVRVGRAVISLLKASLAACAQDEHSGECKGSLPRAQRLLANANSALAGMEKIP